MSVLARKLREKRFWCDCADGPQPLAPARPAPVVRSFEAMPPNLWTDSPAEIEVGSEMPFTLENCARLTYTFWKPITLPIDLKVEVPLR